MADEPETGRNRLLVNQSYEHTDQTAVADRRRFDHVRVSLTISYSILGEEELQSVRAVDLSVGGIRFLDSAELFRDSQVYLRFVLPDLHHEIVARGRVVMSFFDSSQGKYSHSVSFTKIAPGDLEAISHYIYGTQRPEVDERTGT